MTLGYRHVVLLLMALFLCGPPAHADDQWRAGDRDGADVLSAHQVQKATGKTIAQWGAKWWQWAFDHPEVLSDTTGEFGRLGDVGGPVFFALGASGAEPTRASYEVPGGQYILLPVATYIWTFFDPCADVECARHIVNDNFLQGITYVSAQIDGEWVRNLRAHVVRVSDTKPLVFKVDTGPIQPDGYGGILDAVQGGYWLMLEPLRPGKHRISFFSTVPNIDAVTGEIQNGFTDLDTKLKLTVRPKNKH